MRLAISISRLPVLVAVLGIMLAGCGGEHLPGPIKRPVINGVTVETIRPATIDERYEASGTVTARTVSVISSRIMGSVLSVNVREGERVKAGQILLTIDDRDLREKVQAAQSAYNEAMKALSSATEQRDLAFKTYERYKSLYDQKALSTQELDKIITEKNVAEHEFQRVEAMVKRAEAGLKEARVFLGFTRILSPLEGIVSSKTTDTGSMASPGMPLMMVEDDSAYRVEAAVDERFMNTMFTGMNAAIRVAALDEDIAGNVIEIVPSVDPMTRTFVVKLDVTGKDLRSGQYVKVIFSTGRKETLLVPVDSVVRKGQLTGVYRVGEGGIVVYRLVKVGKRTGSSMEILSGIEPGDRIVTGNVSMAIDGGVLAGQTRPGGAGADKEMHK